MKVTKKDKDKISKIAEELSKSLVDTVLKKVEEEVSEEEAEEISSEETNSEEETTGIPKDKDETEEEEEEEEEENTETEEEKKAKIKKKKNTVKSDSIDIEKFKEEVKNDISKQIGDAIKGLVDTITNATKKNKKTSETKAPLMKSTVRDELEVENEKENKNEPVTRQEMLKHVGHVIMERIVKH